MEIFGFKRKKGEVLNHWIAFAERFSLSPLEFYASVEKELATIKVPSMDITKVEFAEGGLLSDKRVYLRMIRERLVFDACAAPFGANYFFSCRTVYIPPIVKLWHVIVLMAFFFGVYAAFVRLLGVLFAGIALVGLLLAIAQVFRNTIALGLSDLDAALIKTHVIGPVYERWFRKETYFRTDNRLMYLHTIPMIIKRLAEDVTGANGVQLRDQYAQAPILGELYKPVAMRTEPK